MSAVYDIKLLNVGDYVINGIDGGFSVVRQCVHGNYYYAECCDELPPGVSTELVAYDIDEDYIPCCG